MDQQLRAKEHFDDRATREMSQQQKKKRDDKESLAYASKILAMTGQEAGLARQCR